MDRQKNGQIIIIAILSVAILTMSIGFATFTENLNISGQVNVSKSQWNIAFDPATYSESAGSVSVAADQRTLTGTSITYNLLLTKPGDFYEFTISVKNTGTFDANLDGITMSTLSTEQKKYLTYKITYDSEDYTATTSGINNLISKSNGTKNVKVRVEYIQPENPGDLPSESVELNLSASLTYTQA